MSVLLTLIGFLVIYDMSISFLSIYSFYILILRPYLKNRNKKKSGLIVDLSLYDKGMYKGAMSFNLTDMIDFVFANVKDFADKDKEKGNNKTTK